MTDTFFAYLRNERDRLERAAAAARSAAYPNGSEIALLQKQKWIVEDQLQRWSRDFARDMIAA